MNDKAVIDRFEGNYAMLLIGDGEQRLNVLRSKLPKGANEGTWLKVELDGKTLIHAEIDTEETENAKKRIKSKLDMLRKGTHKKG